MTIDQLLTHWSVLVSHKFQWELYTGFDFVYPLLFSPFLIFNPLASLDYSVWWPLAETSSYYLGKCCWILLKVEVQSSDPVGIY